MSVPETDFSTVNTSSLALAGAQKLVDDLIADDVNYDLGDGLEDADSEKEDLIFSDPATLF